jgi:hypothetical protein
MLLKKLVVFIVSFISLSAQGIEAGMIFADSDVKMFRIGGNYEFTKLDISGKKTPIYAVAAYAQGAESIVEFSAFEIGARGNYPINDQFFGKAAVMLSFVTATVNYPPLLGGKQDATDSELTIEIGAGYTINENFVAELSYGLSGLDGLRLGVGYNF